MPFEQVGPDYSVPHIEGTTFHGDKNLRNARRKLTERSAQRKFDRFLRALKDDAAKEDAFVKTYQDWADERSNALRLVLNCEKTCALPIAVKDNFDELADAREALAEIDQAKPTRRSDEDPSKAERFHARTAWRLKMTPPNYDQFGWLVAQKNPLIPAVIDLPEGDPEELNYEELAYESRLRIRDICEQSLPLIKGPVYLNETDANQAIVDDVTKLRESGRPLVGPAVTMMPLGQSGRLGRGRIEFPTRVESVPVGFSNTRLDFRELRVTRANALVAWLFPDELIAALQADAAKIRAKAKATYSADDVHQKLESLDSALLRELYREEFFLALAEEQSGHSLVRYATTPEAFWQVTIGEKPKPVLAEGEQAEDEGGKLLQGAPNGAKIIA
jgi:hypothetical protein